MKAFLPVVAVAVMICAVGAIAHAEIERQPVALIFDTDMGNDVDDALALGVIHALERRGECRLLAVTITKDEEMSAPYVDAVNTFYGRPDIPVGVVRNGPTREKSRFTPLAKERDNGVLRYPHQIEGNSTAREATGLLREVLAAQPDASVVVVQVGFSSNLARLLASEPDDHSTLPGKELVAQKVRLLSIMAGAFQLINDKDHLEYNVVKDIPAAQQVADQWPTPIIYSGFEIGLSIPYPAVSIEQDFAYTQHHPLAEAYQLYNPTPHERPTWDLTSVLWAVRPDRGYFGLSETGRVSIDEKGKSHFEEQEEGNHQYLTVDALQIARVREALALLTSEPPAVIPHPRQ